MVGKPLVSGPVCSASVAPVLGRVNGRCRFCRFAVEGVDPYHFLCERIESYRAVGVILDVAVQGFYVFTVLIFLYLCFCISFSYIFGIVRACQPGFRLERLFPMFFADFLQFGFRYGGCHQRTVTAFVAVFVCVIEFPGHGIGSPCTVGGSTEVEAYPTMGLGPLGSVPAAPLVAFVEHGLPDGLFAPYFIGIP